MISGRVFGEPRLGPALSYQGMNDANPAKYGQIRWNSSFSGAPCASTEFARITPNTHSG